MGDVCFGCIQLTLARSIAAGGCYFCLDTKVTKKSSRQIGFFAALASPKPSLALPCKAGRTTGCNYFALLRSLLAPLLQKLAMPLQPHVPALFCPFSPEADLLRKTFGFNYVMGRYEGSSSPCIAALYLVEDSSLPHRMTSVL